MKLPSLAHDKALHVIGGLAAFAFTSPLLLQAGAASWHALIVVLFVGLAKEGADHRANARALRAGLAKPHGVELADVVATVAGGVAGWWCQVSPHAWPWLHKLLNSL